MQAESIESEDAILSEMQRKAEVDSFWLTLSGKISGVGSAQVDDYEAAVERSRGVFVVEDPEDEEESKG